MPNQAQALVLLSGGQDSTTCLALALEEFPNGVHALAFDYGQRHRIELEQAQKIANIAGVPLQILDTRWLAGLSTNALTDPSLPITHLDGKLPSTFVDGRNLFFLSLAAVIAKQKNIHTLYTGVCETDFSGYPDCRADFIQSLNQTLNLGLAYTLKIATPLMWLTKGETVLLMQKLGHLDWYAHSHTCYEGLRPACGKCPACKLRQKGFDDAQLKDPLEYRAVTT